MKRTLDVNGLKNARLRLTVRKYSRKIDISVVVSTYHSFSDRKYKNGFRVVLAKDRYNGKPSLSNVKSIDYGFYCKAYLQASRHGCDEAIILNRQGYVVEGSRSNIFLVRNKSLITPALKCGCLNGITRKVVIKLAKENGIKSKSAFISLENFMDAEEVFLTNSLIGIMPVTYVNNQKINKSGEGSLTARLVQSYKYFVDYYLKKD
jgi:branched-subunit amino acid aminotransferase/4-amino-4-deoxychorismate lyase